MQAVSLKRTCPAGGAGACECRFLAFILRELGADAYYAAKIIYHVL